MAIARICESCDSRIEQFDSLEVQLRVLDPEGSPEQDAKEQAYGDFCNTCIVSGRAVEKLLSRLANYKLEGVVLPGSD